MRGITRRTSRRWDEGRWDEQQKKPEGYSQYSVAIRIRNFLYRSVIRTQSVCLSIYQRVLKQSLNNIFHTHAFRFGFVISYNTMTENRRCNSSDIFDIG